MPDEGVRLALPSIQDLVLIAEGRSGDWLVGLLFLPLQHHRPDNKQQQGYYTIYNSNPRQTAHSRGNSRSEQKKVEDKETVYQSFHKRSHPVYHQSVIAYLRNPFVLCIIHVGTSGMIDSPSSAKKSAFLFYCGVLSVSSPPFRSVSLYYTGSSILQRARTAVFVLASGLS